MARPQIVIATTKSWNIANAERFKKDYADQIKVQVVRDRTELTYELLEKIQPEWVFFPHWSWVISEEIVSSWKCVIFHTAPLPLGRGGSPIQNQIVRGVYESEVCAVQATSELDGGPVFARHRIDLSKGTIDEILMQVSELVFEMIRTISFSTPEPQDQVGEPVVFKRRRPSEGRLPAQATSVRNVYDCIRMLDGEGYPAAFIQYGNQKLELRNARIQPDGSITGTFQLRIDQEGSQQ